VDQVDLSMKGNAYYNAPRAPTQVPQVPAAVLLPIDPKARQNPKLSIMIFLVDTWEIHNVRLRDVRRQKGVEAAKESYPHSNNAPSSYYLSVTQDW